MFLEFCIENGIISEYNSDAIDDLFMRHNEMVLEYKDWVEEWFYKEIIRGVI